MGLTYEQMLQAGATAEPQATPRGLTYEEMLQAGAQEASGPMHRNADPGALQTFGTKWAQAMTAGHADELAGATQAGVLHNAKVLKKVFGGLGDKALDVMGIDPRYLDELGIVDTYRAGRDNARATEAVGDELHKTASLLGTGAGIVHSALLTPGAAGAKAATLGQLVKGGARTGAMFGGAYGFGDSEADLTRGEVGQWLADGLEGAGKGAVFGAAAPLAIRGGQKVYGGAKKLVRALRGQKAAEVADEVGTALASSGADDIAKPAAGSVDELVAAANSSGDAAALSAGAEKVSDEARYLMDKGITKLTRGQKNSSSALGQVEEASTSIPVFGDKVKADRLAGEEQVSDMLLSEAVAPGGSMPIKGDINQKLADIYKGYDVNYDAVRNAPISARAQARPPSVVNLKKALGRIVDDASIPLTEAEASSARRVLDGQMTMLERSGATPDTLMRARSTIRKAGRNLPPNDVRRQVFERADNSITNRLEYALPKDALKTLRATDAKYRDYLVLQKAVRKAGTNDKVSARNINTALGQVFEEGQLARGQGGELQNISKAAHEVFQTRSPNTGARLLTMGWLKYPTGTAALLANAIGSNGAARAGGKISREALERQMALAGALGGRAARTAPYAWGNLVDD